MAAVLLSVSVAGARTRPAPCDPGTFAFAAADQVRIGTALPGIAATSITLGPGRQIALGSCTATATVHARRHATVVTARFATCGGARKVRLQGAIASPACGTLDASLRARHVPTMRFKAQRSNIALESSKAVSDSIGPTGGVLTATSSAGITYTLTIPAGALQAPTTITLTPIKDQQNLPVSGGFAAGADFQPAGLRFAQPVRLTATPLPAPPTGMQLIAVTFGGDGDSLGLAPLADRDGMPITVITHFSGASFVFGTTADIQLLAQQTTTGTANQTFMNQLAALGVPAPPGNPAALPILKAWFASVILPGLQKAANDADLLLAVSDYALWHLSGATYLQGNLPLQPLFPQPDLPVPGLGTEEDQASHAAAPELRAAIVGNDNVCAAQRSVQALHNELYWQQYAHYFGVDSPAEQLDQATVLAHICARVVEVSHSLVSPLQVGFPHTLEVTFGLLFGTDVTPTVGIFGVTVTATGATVQNPTGFTNASGLWGGSVITAQSGVVTIGARGCLLDLGSTTATILCGTTGILSTGTDLTGLWSGNIDGLPVDVTINQNQNAVTGTYVTRSSATLHGVAGTISGTLSGDELLNFSFNQTTQFDLPCTGTFRGDPTVGVSPTEIGGQATGTDCADRSRTDSFRWKRVTTGFSVAGAYRTESCNEGDICSVVVFQYGDSLHIRLAGTATQVFEATIIGNTYAGIGCLPGAPLFSCTHDPTRTISGTFSNGGFSGTVVDPAPGGAQSFSLPRTP